MRASSLFLASLLLCAGPAAAWGPVGHKAVAMLAESRLKPETLAAIRKLAGRAIHLDWIASCADVFAHSTTGRTVCAGTITIEGSPEASKPWHYIEIPISDHPEAASLGRYCPSGKDCVVAQLNEDVRILRDPGASQSAKQTALMYLVHFAGDAHQPLHCAGDGDQGGNFKPTNVLLKNGKPMNLHQVWDHAVDNPGEEDQVLLFADVTAEARALAAAVAVDLKKDEARHPGMVAAWTQNDELAATIALESFKIAQDEIYPQYAKDHGRIADPSDAHLIGKEYHDRMRPIAHRRIEIAGVRLAFLLEKAFGSSRDLSRKAEPLRRRGGEIERALRGP